MHQRVLLTLGARLVLRSSYGCLAGRFGPTPKLSAMGTLWYSLSGLAALAAAAVFAAGVYTESHHAPDQS